MPYLERKPKSQYVYIHYADGKDDKGLPYQEWLKVGGTKNSARVVDYTSFTEKELQQQNLQEIPDATAQEVLHAYEDVNKLVCDYANTFLIGQDGQNIDDLSTIPMGTFIWSHAHNKYTNRIDIIQVKEHGVNEAKIEYISGPGISIDYSLSYNENIYNQEPSRVYPKTYCHAPTGNVYIHL